MFREIGLGELRAGPHHRGLRAALSNLYMIVRAFAVVEQLKAFQASGGHGLIWAPGITLSMQWRAYWAGQE